MNVLNRMQQHTFFEIMKSRRSVGRMTTTRPTREQIECILEAATHAPNHYKVEPWKFFVISGQAREELGEVMAEALAARLGETTSEKAQSQIRKERHKPLQAPVIIAVAVERQQYAWERAIENIEAVSAAVQNMLLRAEDLGLASLWRTGDAAYDPHVKAWFGFAPEDHIVAFVYLGFAAVSLPEHHPTPFEAKTRWLGNEADW
jgi:nitroreductase